MLPAQQVLTCRFIKTGFTPFYQQVVSQKLRFGKTTASLTNWQRKAWKPGFVGDSDGKATRWGHVDVSVWSTDEAETMRCWTRLNVAFVAAAFPSRRARRVMSWLVNDCQTLCKSSARVLDWIFLYKAPFRRQLLSINNAKVSNKRLQLGVTWLSEARWTF